jgi:hypothetical protein
MIHEMECNHSPLLFSPPPPHLHEMKKMSVSVCKLFFSAENMCDDKREMRRERERRGK